MKRRAPHPCLRQACGLLAAGFSLTHALAQNPGQAAPEEDIRGPRAPIEIPAPARLSTTKKVLIATPVAATAGLLLWYFMFRRGHPLLTVSPVDQAREALRGIDRQRESLPAGDLAEQTANVVRRFIAGNFGIAAPQRTTEEFLQSLTTTHHSPLQPHAVLLQEFLTTCDKAKFAGAEFDPVERFALLDNANRFVQAAAYSAPGVAPAPPVPSSPVAPENA
jgi:hypothetical protein